MNMDTHRVTVVIPAYEEEAIISKVVREVRALHTDFEILVVDDGSIDRTAEEARRAGARVIRHPYNIGNGAAVKTGIRHASGEIVVLMDGDGQHAPNDMDKLLNHMAGHDMVVGARTKGSSRSFHRYGANLVYNLLASYVTHFHVQDLTSGFRAIRTSVARRYLHLLPNTFSYPSTLTLSLLRSGRSIRFVPIVTRERKGKSKIRLFLDGSRFFLIIVRIALLYSPLRIFLPVSLTQFLAGLGWYLYTYFTQNRFTNMSLLLFLSGLTIFMLGLVSEQIALLRMDGTEKRTAEETRDEVTEQPVRTFSEK